MPTLLSKIEIHCHFSNIENFLRANSIAFQTAIEYVESLGIEEQDLLIELIQKRRIENRRVEIANNAREILTALKAGTAKRGNLAQLKANLLDEE